MTVGMEGKTWLARLAAETAAVFAAQAEADNHAVREAACHCIAELAVHVEHGAVAPYVEKLLGALLDCFRDESWPVRDAACEACGHFVRNFPAESADALPELLQLWFTHLADNIGSVREHSATALANVLPVLSAEDKAKVAAELRRLLPMALSQPAGASTANSNLGNETQFGVAYGAPRDDHAGHNHHDHGHEDQPMFSCGSLAPKLRKAGVGCMDHGVSRPAEPWESTDGALHLLAELALLGEPIADTLATVAEVVTIPEEKQFPHYSALLLTFWRRLHDVAQGLPPARWPEAVVASVRRAHERDLAPPSSRLLQAGARTGGRALSAM